MERPDHDSDRETIWGISPGDRRWFQVMTLVGGNVGSIVVTLLTLKHRPADQTPDALALSLPLGIGASFVAAGFVAWNVVQIKELTMAIADWIREATERRRQRLRAEGYRMGYEDAQQGKPCRPPTDKPEAERPKGDQAS